MSKVVCHKCGHFNMIATDHGWVKGCSAFALMFEEMRNEFQEEAKRVDVTITPIDTKFLLNKNDDCEVWIEQNDLQKTRIAELKKHRRKHFFSNLLLKLFGRRAA